MRALTLSAGRLKPLRLASLARLALLGLGLGLYLWLGLAGVTAAQTALQPIPPLSARVIDTSGTLDAAQRQALEAKLAALETARGSQVVVLVVPTTLPEDIADYTQRVGELWKVGRKGIGDGLLLVVAKNDRAVRIATAKTLEGAIPDLAARQIIEQAITPRFREGDFAGGLNAGIDKIGDLIAGEKLPRPAAVKGKGRPGFQWLDLAVLLFIALPLAARLLGAMVGRKAGALLVGAGAGVVAGWLTASVVIGVLAGMAGLVVALAGGLASYGPRGPRGPFGPVGTRGWQHGPGSFGDLGGGGGGGGFRSGGGGDFGGGGASGKW